MSTVIQCDVCKKIIADKKKMIRVQEFNESEQLHQEYYDVCNECWQRFITFKQKNV